MLKLKAGDKVECRIKAGTIRNAYDEYDDVKTFEIVAVDNEGYYLFVPHYIFLNEGSVASEARCRSLGIDRAFVGESITYVLSAYICKVVSELDGMKCSRCRDFFGMAAPNQKDGTFLCRACKENPYR
jgi:hypothetical protein